MQTAAGYRGWRWWKRGKEVTSREFIGRFQHHVRLRGFKRIRHYELLAAHHKRARLAAARTALQTPDDNRWPSKRPRPFLFG